MTIDFAGMYDERQPETPAQAVRFLERSMMHTMAVFGFYRVNLTDYMETQDIFIQKIAAIEREHGLVEL